MPDQVSTVEYGEQIRRARVVAGLSQRQLAKRVGLSRKTLAAIERGAHVPADAEFHALAETLGTATAARLDPALEIVLREYLAMVGEMRAISPHRITTLRDEDLQILAAALDDTPEQIEAQLRRVLSVLSDETHERLQDPQCA